MKNVYLIKHDDNRIENIILVEDNYSPPAGFFTIENDGAYSIGDTYGQLPSGPTPEEIAEAEKQAIRSQIDQLERAYMYPRGQRELDLHVMEKFALEQGITASMLYEQNILYRKLKDLNDQVQALRNQL